jgi:3-hydroxyisobutyrate dehydrogenase
MGGPMAANLAGAGHAVTVWNRSADKAVQLAGEIGVGVADTPRALAEGSEAVVTMLADDTASDKVHRGADGLFAAGGPRTLLEMGTMSPDHIRALAADAPDGVTVIDAPVSGATKAAEAAQLMIMVGADGQTAAPVMPLFEAMGRKTILMGQVGAGAVMKLAVNSLIHGMNQTLAEALTLAEAAGIDPEAAFDAVEASAAAAPMFSYRRPQYLDEAHNPVTFTVDLAAKDMDVTTRLAAGLGVRMPQGTLNLETLRAAADDGYGPRDMASMLQYVRGMKT